MRPREIDIYDEVHNRFGEWIEHAGEKDAPALIIAILCKMVIKERELIEYYQRRVDNV
jgi:hypothetical protein